MIGFAATLNILLAMRTVAGDAGKPIVLPAFVGGVSPRIVFDDPSFFDSTRRCFDRYPFSKFGASADDNQKKCLADYMKGQGATAQAIALMRAAPVPAAALAVRSYGVVAVVHAAMLWADGSDGWAIIGKSGELIPLWTPLDIETDRTYREFLKEHPKASLWSDTVGWPQVVSAAGGARLAFDFSIKVCHACARLGTATVIYDFNRGGHFQAARLQRIIAQPAQ